MTGDTIRMLSGDCTVRFESGDDPPEERRGIVLVVVKPDDTVLVHDRAGYRPAAWLTRADDVSVMDGDGRTVIDASDGDRRLVVTSHDEDPVDHRRVSGVGEPVGECSACQGALVREPTAVSCLRCERRNRIPRDAKLLDERCPACANPMMRVERGAVFELCVDRACESLDDRVRLEFDGVWTCPACGSPLRIRRRGGLIAGCEAYPGCETAFAIPVGVRNGTCGACGLPSFETGSGPRCLDAGCPGPV